jgi:stage III sporulation protein AE
MTWLLKLTLYLFTGYLSITGVVSGSIDSQTLKATKLTISGFVPVIGNILSDASEALLVSTALIKNAAGVYGMLAIIAVGIGPFLNIALQGLLLRITAGLCGLFGSGANVKLMKDISVCMGFLVAMTATVTVLLLISTVCFMKGGA